MGNWAEQISSITMLTYFSRSFDDIEFLINAVTFSIGIFFVISAANTLKSHAINPHNNEGKLGFAIASLLTGVFLIDFSTSIGTIAETMFGDGPQASILDYVDPAVVDERLKTMYEAIFGFIRLVGLWAFAKGLVVLRNTARPNGGGQDNSVGKGLTHVFGGAIAINLGAAAQILKETFMG